MTLFRGLRLPRLPHLPGVPWHGREPIGEAALHGTSPFAAWEAELTAYAHLRTGSTRLKVVFAYAETLGWGDEVHLLRPAHPNAPHAFEEAELELEHLLTHYRHGWRETTLFWFLWAEPAATVQLAWAPWDHAPLPAMVARLALAEALPALQIPPEAARWRERERHAARWLAAAWADGVHRRLEIGERPGLADRLPVPRLPERPSAWEKTLHALAAGTDDLLQGQAASDALRRLLAVAADDLEEHVQATTALVSALQRSGNILPPAHRQRLPWLRPDWGRWHRDAALRAALDHLARSPTSAAVARATAAGRTLARITASHGIGGTGGRPAGPERERSSGPDRRSIAADLAADQAPPDESEWGVPRERSLTSPQRAAPSAQGAEGGEGEGTIGQTGSGSGPGTLGALHVVNPTNADRAAYWQLRGALAPEIERLVERLQASTDAYYASAPRRFQRAGRLDRSRLPAAVAGREAVFIRHIHEPAPAHTLCLLLDCSASMCTRAEQLREVAILVESAAAAVGARVTAFNFGAQWERMEPAGEGVPLLALGRELHPHGGTPFGPAVAAAAEWLAHQPYEHRRLWVFSDGQWSARDRAEANWRPEWLHDLVVWVLGEEAPDPPVPEMRLVAVPTLDDLIQQAPHYFWATDRKNGPPRGHSSSSA